MDPWAPINGISLERYAELAADVADTQDPAKQAEIVGQKGVSGADWEAAKSGWTARMQDMSLMGQVATRFMPMYQAALAKKSSSPGGGGPPTVSYEDYVAMCGCPPVIGFEGMLAHYKITMTQWTQIAGHWNQIIATNPQYGMHGMRVEQEAARIRAGGAPTPVTIGGGAPAGGAPGAQPPPQEASLHAVSGAMPGAVPPGYAGAAAGYPQPQAWPGQAAAHPGYGAQPGHAPQPGYAQPGYPQQPGHAPQPGYAQPGYPQQPAYNQQAQQFGHQVGGALSAFGSALGGVVSSVVGTFQHGQHVMVQWSDGQRYPGTVIMQQSGQVQVGFPDGRQVWVPQHVVVAR